jgi:hypothetical protein
MKKLILCASIFMINLYSWNDRGWSILFKEGFNNDTIPSGWKVIDGNSSGISWTVGPSPDSAYAYFAFDTMICYNEELISPSILIPENAESLRIGYFYAFQTYEIGPKYKVKVRKYANGNWSSWNTIALYTNNSAGFDLISLTSYLPADSIQFNWFYGDSSVSNPFWVVCVVDSVILEYFYPQGLEDKGKIGEFCSTPSIEIYDVSGNLIKKIFVPNVYFLKLNFGKFQKTKKVIILK